MRSLSLRKRLKQPAIAGGWRPGERAARAALTLVCVVAVALLLSLTGCQSRTDFGECVGLNEADRNPGLHYRISTRNVVLGVVFVETIFSPIVVLLSELYCPDGPARSGTVGR